MKTPDLTRWDRFCHWLGWWCGMKMLRGADGKVVVEIRCPVCTKNAVTPQAWERLKSHKE